MYLKYFYFKFQPKAISVNIYFINFAKPRLTSPHKTCPFIHQSLKAE